jgi:hypothetical protein
MPESSTAETSSLTRLEETQVASYNIAGQALTAAPLSAYQIISMHYSRPGPLTRTDDQDEGERDTAAQTGRNHSIALYASPGDPASFQSTTRPVRSQSACDSCLEGCFTCGAHDDRFLSAICYPCDSIRPTKRGLAALALLTAMSAGGMAWVYFATPLAQRPFRSDSGAGSDLSGGVNYEFAVIPEMDVPPRTGGRDNEILTDTSSQKSQVVYSE